MFTEAIQLIKNKEYDNAVAKLLPLSSSDDEAVKSQANYFLGYIYTQWDYTKKNSKFAKRYLYDNLNSPYPQPFAYALYSDVVEDINIAINYLEKGIQQFPKEPTLYMKLLKHTTDKNSVVTKIQALGFHDPTLLGSVISFLISSQQWSKINRFIFRIRNGNKLEAEEEAYLKLIESYAYLFGKIPNYQKAQISFEALISWDTDNQFAYSHYLGLIYTFIKTGNIDKATEYFDRLPINNSIYDLDDGPCPLGIYINFETMYRSIFDELISFFSKDNIRKNKAQVLYSMYLYYPSEIYDLYRYKKSDALALANYLKATFNTKVAAALFNMRCHFKQFKEAYEILWDFLKNHENPFSEGVFSFNIINNIPDNDLGDIISSTITHLQTDDFDQNLFIKSIFSELIKHLHSLNLYESIQNIAHFLTTSDILDSDCSFECAFAYGNNNDIRASEIYEEIIKKEPTNATCINNLGVQHEHRQNLYDALNCFDKAVSLHPSKTIYVNNQTRIRKSIQDELKSDICHFTDTLSVDELEKIGYTIDLCKKIHSINDTAMRDILLRDLKECAIAVVLQQDKLASIMCGSIIEALLMYEITRCNISKYDISEISKKKHATTYAVNDMCLNELLYVAHKENLISTNSYHLGHYVRDYRNIVHPAKEKRMIEEISHENVLMMWSILQRLANELLHTK